MRWTRKGWGGEGKRRALRIIEGWGKARGGYIIQNFRKEFTINIQTPWVCLLARSYEYLKVHNQAS